MMASKVEIKLNTTDVSRESNYGIIHTQWNKAVVQILLENTKKELISQGVAADNINCTEVPGAFELPYAAKKMIQQGFRKKREGQIKNLISHSRSIQNMI